MGRGVVENLKVLAARGALRLGGALHRAITTRGRYSHDDLYARFTGLTIVGYIFFFITGEHLLYCTGIVLLRPVYNYPVPKGESHMARGDGGPEGGDGISGSDCFIFFAFTRLLDSFFFFLSCQRQVRCALQQPTLHRLRRQKTKKKNICGDCGS